MTQEEKEILIKDLCARLPYGVIVEWGCKYEHKDLGEIKSQLTGRMLDSFVEGRIIGLTKVYSIKPYLRPLSNMSVRELYKARDLSIMFADLDGERIFDGFGNVDANTQLKAIDWLNAHNFDYRGLIGRGLALEAPKDMYNQNK